jgi:N-acetylneuraminic acid mutarotase
MRNWKKSCVFIFAALTVLNFAGCGGAGGSNVTPQKDTYTIGGTVSGLSVKGLVLQDNGGNDLAVSASGAFTFSAPLAGGSAYAVTILTQPSVAQSCAVASGSGTASANVTNVQVTCSTEWVWMGGQDTVDQPGIYGTQSVAAATNIPGARAGSVTWTDSSGNFWLFGGFDYTSSGNEVDFNDLWKYSPSQGEWTWVGGSPTGGAAGVYGKQGQAAASNTPGARDTAASWADSSGNLWLFGGRLFDSSGNAYQFNDLWKYNPSTGYWTWVGGSPTAGASGVYGMQGVSATGNVPGARQSAVSWTDSSGNFWLFGGVGYDSTGSGDLLNDLWKYNPNNGQWTWMQGDDFGYQSGIYGTQGIASATNIPGARVAAVNWTDSSGNLWLFGGTGMGTGSVPGELNDLWRHTPSTGYWTWMSGSTTINTAGFWGTQGIGTNTTVPGTRQSSASWTDLSGNLWLYGGTDGDFDFSDLWEYSQSTGEWTWMAGSNLVSQVGSYGTVDIAAAGDFPGARDSAAVWTDSSGNFWLFGGQYEDANGNWYTFNDLWEC